MQRCHALSAAEITRYDGRAIVPYDLRHTWASLLIAEGRHVFEVAEQLGLGAEQTLRTYGHVIGAYREGERIDVAAEIRRIRARGGVLVAEDVPAEFPRRSAAASILGA